MADHYIASFHYRLLKSDVTQVGSRLVHSAKKRVPARIGPIGTLFVWLVYCTKTEAAPSSLYFRKHLVYEI